MSFKAWCFHYFMKYRHLIKGKLRAEVISIDTNIQTLRFDTEQMAERLAKPIVGVTFLESAFTEFYSEWVKVEGVPNDKVILYFHGGGFVMGSARSHRNIVGNFCKRLNCNALVFDYRLAPEHPSPAAVVDGAKIYCWLLEQGYQPQNIIFAGDSAGAGIELAVLIKLKDDGISMPKACVAFSPCTDMTLSGDSHFSRIKKDPCTPKGANETYTRYYVGEGDPKHPYASPLFGDLQGLPPLFIQVGDNETLLDDSVRFAAKARAAGVDVQLEVWPGMFHCFPLMAPMFKEADIAMDRACSFIRRRFDMV